jgi:hypothetical protein
MALSMESISISWSPARTISPAALPIRARATGERTDTRTLQAYLGHRNISNTVRYTELAASRFKNLWKD